MTKFMLTGVLLLCFMVNVSSQSDTDKNKNVPQGVFSNWGIGINAGTTGAGGSIITRINPHFFARAGFDYAGYTYKPDDMELDVEYDGQDLTAKVNSLKLKFPDAKLEFI